MSVSADNNFKIPGTGMDIYGKQRLELGMLLRDKVLNELKIPWVIENGILLGAYRTGKFIKHDDDFDIGLFFESDPSSIAIDVLNKLKQLLPKTYDARYISTYCQKIEVYDPTYGSFVLSGPQYNGANFHYVTADLQFYQRFGNIYRCLYSGCARVIEIPADAVFPLGCMTVECESFPSPADAETYLKCWYGSLSPTAKYNPDTGLYEDNEKILL